MRKKLVAGNWKMHGSLKANAALVDGIKAEMAGLACDVLLCVPFPYLAQVGSGLVGSSVKLGAQNVSEYASGAYTGEVSASMLADLGCQYALVGHSERRTLYGESDSLSVAKCKALLEHGIRPVLCVGETLAEREAGETQLVVSRQVAAVLGSLDAEQFSRLVIAYEPVWAIGTGKTASPEQAQQVHAVIRQQVADQNPLIAKNLLILYGGSVKPQTAEELFNQPDIDGGLIGGAALVVADFLAICRAAN
jgi:triosephosphate isomerase (TIM)